MSKPTDNEERVTEKAHNTFAAHIRNRRNRLIRRRRCEEEKRVREEEERKRKALEEEGTDD